MKNANGINKIVRLNTLSSQADLLAEIEDLNQKLHYYRSHDLSAYVFGKPTPAAHEIEDIVIGSCLIDSEAFTTARDLLAHTDFEIGSNELIFSVMTNIREAGHKIDLLSVVNFIREKHQKEIKEFWNGNLEPYALVELTNRVASTANLEYHTRILKQKSISRQLIKIYSEGLRKAYEEQQDVFDICDESIRKINSLNHSLNPIFIGGTAEKIMQMAENAPDIQLMVGNMFKTGDLALMLAPKKTGKTIFGYQFADNIANGKCHFNGVLTNETKAKKVLYIDLELNLSDFKERYRNPQSKVLYPFSKNLHIKMLNPSNFCYDQVKMLQEIEKIIIDIEPEVLIIDNLTALMKSISDADSALLAIRTLLSLNYRYGLSTCVMCHTPKKIGNLPLTSDDILGSGIFLNLCTSIFGIRRSFQNRSIIYLKHLDTRNTQLIYDEDNVILMRIEKVDNFTQMVFEGTGKEADHLIKKGDEAEGEIYHEAIKLYNKGMAWSKVKSELNYQYTPQGLQKACIKFAERSKSYVYIPSQQKFVDWFDAEQELLKEEERKMASEIPFEEEEEKKEEENLN